MSLPAHFPELKVIPADLKSALSSEIIALGFVAVENSDPEAEKEFKLVGSTLLLKALPTFLKSISLMNLNFLHQPERLVNHSNFQLVRLMLKLNVYY